MKKKYPRPYRRGASVTQIWHGIRRFGVISRTFVPEDDRWTHCEVIWVDDEQYETAIEERLRFSKLDYRKTIFRVDELEVLTVERMVHVMTLLAAKRTNMVKEARAKKEEATQ